MENGIFGIQPWAVLLVLVIGILVFIIWSQNRGMKRLQKLTEGKTLVDFWTKSGEVKSFLCEEIKGELKPPKDYKGDAKRLKGFKSPEEIESDIDVYYTTPEFTGDTWYPPLRPKGKQVRIKKAAFIVGLPLPAIYYNQEKWTSEMLENLASSLIGLSKDEKTLEALNKQDSRFWDDLHKFGKMLGKLPTMQIACFAAAGGAVIAMFLSWQLSSKIDNLFNLLTGGGG